MSWKKKKEDNGEYLTLHPPHGTETTSFWTTVALSPPHRNLENFSSPVKTLKYNARDGGKNMWGIVSLH